MNSASYPYLDFNPLVEFFCGSLPAYFHETKVKIANTELKLKIAFSSSSKTLRLVGRQGLFENFVVCFNDDQKEVTFTKIKPA